MPVAASKGVSSKSLFTDGELASKVIASHIQLSGKHGNINVQH